MKKTNSNEWLDDYQEFLSQPKEEVPQKLAENTFLKIQNFLRPSAVKVFLKLLSVHIVTGALSLSICHQFGMNPFNTKQSLADWFMKVGGHHFCMLGCGVLFVGLSVLAAGYFLSVEEVRALKRTEFLQNLSLGLISIGFFAAFGAEMALSIAGLWLLGALVGGVAATGISLKLRSI